MIQTDLTPYPTITVGRASGVAPGNVGADITGAPSYLANFNAVREGTNLNGVVRLQMFTAANVPLGSCTGALFDHSPIVVTAARSFILASTLPEPSTVVLLGGGLLALGIGAVRKRRQS